MKVQSTPSIAEQIMQSQSGSSAPPPSETAFQELLTGAMQAKTPEKPQPEPHSETSTPAQEPVPTQNTEPEQKVQTPAESPEAPSEPDDGTAQNLLATVIASQMIPPPVTQTLSIEAPPQTVSVQGVPAPAVPTQEALPDAPVSQPVTAQEAAPQPAEAQPAQQSREPQSSQLEPLGSGIESAELVEEPATPPVTDRQHTVTEPGQNPEAQTRFDAMVQDASARLQGKEPAAEAQEPAAEAPPKTAQEPIRTIPQELRRKSDVSEETLTMAANPQPVAEELPAQPEVQSEAPRSTPEATPVRQVETQVTRQLEEGRMEFHMQLNPQELGKVSVKMVLEDGKLAVHIAAATEKAFEALRKESDGLLASLRAQGIQVETVSVVPEAQSASGRMDSPFGMAMGGQHGNSPGEQNREAARNGLTQSGDTSAGAFPEEAQPERLLDAAV